MSHHGGIWWVIVCWGPSPLRVTPPDCAGLCRGRETCSSRMIYNIYLHGHFNRIDCPCIPEFWELWEGRVSTLLAPKELTVVKRLKWIKVLSRQSVLLVKDRCQRLCAPVHAQQLNQLSRKVHGLP